VCLSNYLVLSVHFLEAKVAYIFLAQIKPSLLVSISSELLNIVVLIGACLCFINLPTV
jgi:hypothetical protein